MNSANPDALELAPLPLPRSFESDMDRPVLFDAATSASRSASAFLTISPAPTWRTSVGRGQRSPKGAVKDLPVFQEAYEAGKNC